MKSNNSDGIISVFISYAREDEKFASIIKESLSDHGFSVWKDKDNILATENWWEAIQRGIIESDYFIFLASKASIADECICSQEIKFAKELNKLIVPMSIDSELEWLPKQISHINWIDFSAFSKQKSDDDLYIMVYSQEFKKSFNQLISVFKTDVDWVKLFTKLLQKTWEWKSQNKNTSYLLIGDELYYFKDAIQKFEGKEPFLIEDQKDLIKESEIYAINELKRKTRNRKILLSLAISVFVIAFVAIILGISNRRKILENLAIDLAKKSELILENSALSLLLSVKANQIDPSSITKASLFDAVINNQYSAYNLILPQDAQLNLKEDKLIATYCLKKEDFCSKSEVRVINLQSYQDAIPPIQVEGKIYSPEINSEQSYIGFLSVDVEKKCFLQVYDIQGEDAKLKLNKKMDGLSLIFGMDDNEVITGASSHGKGFLEFWDINTGAYIREPINTGGAHISSLIINKTEKKLYGIDIVSLFTWDFSTESVKTVSKFGAFHPYVVELPSPDAAENAIPGTTLNYVQMVMSSDGKYIATKSTEEIIVWNTSTETAIEYINTQSMEAKKCMSFIPKSHVLAYCDDNSIIFFNVESHETIMSIDQKNINNFLISESGRFVVFYYSNREVTILDTSQGNKMITKENNVWPSTYLEDFSINESYVVVKDGESLILLNHNLEEIKRIEGICNYSFDISKNQDMIVLGCIDGKFLLMEFLSEKILAQFSNGDGSRIENLFITPDDKSIIIISQLGNLSKYDIDSGEIIWDYKIGNNQALLGKAANLSPDGNYLILPALLYKDEFTLVDISGEIPIFVNPTAFFDYVNETSAIFTGSFSPNSKISAFILNDNRVLIYDILGDEVIQVITRDGKLLPSSSFLDTNLFILSIATGNQITSPITGLQMRENNQIEIWDISRNLKIAEIPNAHQGTIRKIIEIDENQFISASHDGSIKFWNISNNLLENIACEIAGRDFSREEWEKYIGGILDYSITCEQKIEALDKNQVHKNPSSSIDILLKMGIDSRRKAEIIKYDPTLDLDNDYQLITDIENSTNNIIVEQPQILQCREYDNRYIYVNNYFLAWPINLIGQGKIGFQNNIFVENTGLNAIIINSDGTEKSGGLFGLHHPGNFEIIIPSILVFGEPLSLLNETTLKFKIDSIPIIDDYYNDDVFNNILIEDVTPNTHLNIHASDINFPMHTIKVKFTNGTDYVINSIMSVAIIYNQNNEMTDFLINLTPEIPYLQPDETKRFLMQSYSLSGRCIGYSDPFSAIKVRLWFSFELDVDGELQYYQRYQEVDWGK
ncbi:toll/interleukin-1 receptor domain-containing protein [Candidatus Dojkabacteria bacterium]|nr:toll/interleukin-1 receptor domain-containing protein [Candidatus Dojkabacteria bacterium]